jgi:hypothetical protein
MMTFDDAKATTLRFGKHAGRTLDEIASDDEGLKYLDWLVSQPWLQKPMKEALEVYLDDPGIARDLENLLGD